MKNIKQVFVYSLIIVSLIGCGVNVSASKLEENMENEISERQLEILKECGFSSKEIREMQEEGMPALTQNFVENAEEALALMEEKYGISFGIKGGTTPSVLTDDYEFYLYAKEGPFKEVRFTVEYNNKNEEKEWRFYEGYYGLVMADNIQKELQSYVDEKDIPLKVFAYSDCQIEISCDRDDYEAIKDAEVDIQCYVSKDVSDEDFVVYAEEVDNYIHSQGYWIYLRAYRVTDDKILDTLNSYSDIYDKYDGAFYDNGLSDLLYKNGEIIQLGD